MNRQSRHDRRGLAPVELLMFLPLLVAMWLLLLAVGSVGVATPQAAADAQRKVWSERHQTAPADEMALASTGGWWQRVYRHQSLQSEDAGLTLAETKFTPQVYLDSLAERLPEGARQSALLADPWDHRVIAFPAAGEQRPLEVTPLAAEFIGPEVAARFSQRLLDFN